MMFTVLGIMAMAGAAAVILFTAKMNKQKKNA